MKPACKDSGWFLVSALKSSGSPPRICVGCKGPILDQFILRVAPNQEWHGSCLKCSECKMSLDETCTCFVRDQKIYCKNDYVRYGWYLKKICWWVCVCVNAAPIANTEPKSRPNLANSPQILFHAPTLSFHAPNKWAELVVSSLLAWTSRETMEPPS